MKTPYEVNTTKLISVVDESSTIRTFRLEPKPIEFKAGQFAELAVPGIGEAPFTPSSSQYDKEKMEFTIMKVGRLTSALFNLKPGDTVGVRGPYGKPYPVEKFKGKEIFIVGGGVGFAPLRALFLTLLHKIEDYKKIYIRYGARTPDDIIYKQFIPEWSKLDKVDIKMSVDVGTKDWSASGGKVGVVTVLLDEIPVSITDSSVIVCGPPIMIKFVTKKLLELGFPGSNIYLSMESNMSCGIGQCNHCRIGELYSCKDGPVFTWDQIKHIKDPFI
ncbi:MAG: FAD/NAD(P)-binding protein [bacterium]